MAVSRDPVFFGRFEPLLLQADILPLDSDRLDEHLRQARRANRRRDPGAAGARGGGHAACIRRKRCGRSSR